MKFILSILIPLGIIGQCPNDLCADAIELDDCVYTSFSNETCLYNFEDNGMYNTVGTGLVTPCHSLNFDLWYSFPYSGDGYLTIDVGPGDCYNPIAGTSDYGRNEGWVLMVWKGDTCEDAQIVWSTNCYWLTEDVPADITQYFGIGSYDPTRQSWNIMFLDAPQGKYFIQIDGFGPCRGSSNIRVCSAPAAPLSIDIPSDTVLIGTELEIKTFRRFDNIGRQLR